MPCRSGKARCRPSRLGGGITNINFVVQDAARRCVVRIGDDIPVHQIMRFNELAASRAAHAAGVSPEVLYHEAGALVIDFIEGRTLTAAEDLRQDRPAGSGAGPGGAGASRHSPAFPRRDDLVLGVSRCCATIRSHAARR